MSFFVVRAKEKDGTRVYLCQDTASGGYPYWSESIVNADFKNSKEKLEHWLTDHYATMAVSDMEIVELVEKEIE